MMAMIDAFTAAVGLFGLGAVRPGAPAEPLSLGQWPDEAVRQEWAPPVPEPLSIGDPCYEAVAEALKAAGYLHS